MDVVVGSGPSGVAVAAALLAAGRNVTMVDAGVTIEPERSAQRQNLARRAPETWNAADLEFLKGAPQRRGAVPDKLSYGSDYPYAIPSGARPLEAHGAALKPSYAVGGLSTVWGSALLPFRDADLINWPIASRDLDEGYKAAAKLMPLSAVRDDLEATFPLHRTPDAALAPSRQAQSVMTHLSSNRARLSASGITFGQARLAVDAAPCVSCGLCLRGCPHELIYSASATRERQRAAGLVIKSGLLARTIDEDAEGVSVRAIAKDGTAHVLRASRVFLAAGVIGTTEIMLRSMGWLDRPVMIRDAQYFLVPVVSRRGTASVERERLHALCQAFLELEDRALSSFTIHMQLYTYSAILGELIRAKAGLFANVLPLGLMLGRLMVLQSYLHSDDSGTIEATLRSAEDGDRLTLVGHAGARTRLIVDGVARKLGRLSGATGFHPLRPLIEITEPGRGYHAGASFPMARYPRLGETDTIGRPAGFQRIHLVDASCLPSIPATTITFAVMANAYRIGAAIARTGLP